LFPEDFAADRNGFVAPSADHGIATEPEKTGAGRATLRCVFSPINLERVSQKTFLTP